MQEHGEDAGLNNPGAPELEAKLGAKGFGLPFFAFLDAQGELIVNSQRPVEGKPGGVNVGYPYEPEEVDWFITMLEKAVPGLPANETQAIEKYLRSQKKSSDSSPTAHH